MQIVTRMLFAGRSITILETDAFFSSVVKYLRTSASLLMLAGNCAVDAYQTDEYGLVIPRRIPFGLIF